MFMHTLSPCNSFNNPCGSYQSGALTATLSILNMHTPLPMQLLNYPCGSYQHGSRAADIYLQAICFYVCVFVYVSACVLSPVSSTSMWLGMGTTKLLKVFLQITLITSLISLPILVFHTYSKQK